jgi:hypothetical protein
MRSFITGSRAYGRPKWDSDVDLVIFVDDDTKEDLIKLSDDGKMPCRYGKLNLIFATTEEEYAAWLLGKKLCTKRMPVTTAEANVQHDEARDLFGTNYDRDSGES